MIRVFLKSSLDPQVYQGNIFSNVKNRLKSSRRSEEWQQHKVRRGQEEGEEDKRFKKFKGKTGQNYDEFDFD